MQRRPWLTKGATLSPSTPLYSPVQRRRSSTLHCLIAVAPLLHCRRSTALLLHCFTAVAPRSTASLLLVPASLLRTTQKKMVNCQLRNEQHTNLLPEVEECCAQEATIEALPNRIWETRKVRVDILGVNDQGTELSPMLFRNWLPLGSLPNDYSKGTTKFPYRQIDPHLRNGMD